MGCRSTCAFATRRSRKSSRATSSCRPPARPSSHRNVALNADLLALVPPGARRVVEAGCADGVLARAYLARHPGCEYVGIELDAAKAALARPGLARVIEADI